MVSYLPVLTAHQRDVAAKASMMTRNKLKTFLLAGAMLGTATIANAAEFRTWTDDRNILNVVMTGEIMPGDSVKLANTLGNRRPRIMFLRSPGGDFDAGLEIAYYVRDKGFETVIPPDATCASMCGLIWLASDVRWIAPNGHVGFHAVRYVKSQEVAASGMALVGAYLSRLGFSDITIIALSDERDFWLTNDKAQRLGIVAKTIPAEPQKRPQGGVDVICAPGYQNDLCSRP